MYEFLSWPFQVGIIYRWQHCEQSGLVVRRRYLQERIHQVEDERSHALSTIAKYKVLFTRTIVVIAGHSFVCGFVA